MGLICILAAISIGLVQGYLSLALVVLLGAVVALVPVILNDSRARLIYSVAGALLTFQSDSATAKNVYFAGLLLCWFVSMINLVSKSAPWGQVVAASALFEIYLAGTFPISAANGVGFGDWLRDCIAYFLISFIVVIGIDASSRISQTGSIRLVAGFGTVSAVGFASDWLHRRGAVDSLGRFILASLALPGLAFCLTLVHGSFARRRGCWYAAAVLIAVSLIVTGTRTSLAWLIVGLLGTLGSAARKRIPLGRLVRIAAGITALVAASVSTVASHWLNPRVVSGRVAATMNLTDGSLDRDVSYQFRQRAYSIAHQSWTQNPWFGTGPGHIYHQVTGDGFSLDTPWLVPAKFGVVGTAILVAFLLTIANAIRVAVPVESSVRTIGRAWMLCLVATVAFGPWTEDKGFAAALGLLVCLAAATTNVPDHNDALDRSLGRGTQAQSTLSPVERFPRCRPLVPSGGHQTSTPNPTVTASGRC